MSQHFLDRENGLESMNMEQAKVMFLKVWNFFYKRIYYEALDLIVCGIKQCFDQPGYKLYSNLEALLVRAAKKETYDGEFQFVINFYKDDFDHNQLNMQLRVLSSNIQVN